MIVTHIVTIYLTGKLEIKKKQLIIPYTLDNNDMRFATNQGFNTGDHFFYILKR